MSTPPPIPLGIRAFIAIGAIRNVADPVEKAARTKRVEKLFEPFGTLHFRDVPRASQAALVDAFEALAKEYGV